MATKITFDQYHEQHKIGDQFISTDCNPQHVKPTIEAYVEPLSTSAIKHKADQGDPATAYQYAVLKLKEKTAKANQEALKYLEKAANAGYVQASFVLGKMYLKGYGVAQNDAKAIKHFLQAKKNTLQPHQNSIEPLSEL